MSAVRTATRPTGIARWRHGVAAALLLLVGVAPIAALAKPTDRSSARGHPVTETRNTASTTAARAGSSLSDIAAVMLLLSGFYAFVYARRRNLLLQQQRLASGDETTPEESGGPPRGRGGADFDSPPRQSLSSSRHATQTRVSSAGNGAGEAPGRVVAARRHGQRRCASSQRACTSVRATSTRVRHADRMRPE